jgi:hypothetical protein
MTDSLATNFTDLANPNYHYMYVVPGEQTDVYTLSMSYDPTGVTDAMVHSGLFALAVQDADGNWINAVDKNVGGSKHFVVGPWTDGDALGTYGVDPSTHTAWAVINHNSDFAVASFTPPAVKPSWIYLATTSNASGIISVAWGASSTPGATYVLEESTDSSFTSTTVVYTGSNLTTNLTGRTNGSTYYYRVKAQAAGYVDSAYVNSSNGCTVAMTAGKPSWIYLATTSNASGVISVAWGASSTPGATYVLEESTDPSFTTTTGVYNGTNLTKNLYGRTNGTTYYYRVKAQAAGYVDSAYVNGSNGCIVNIH